MYLYEQDVAGTCGGLGPAPSALSLLRCSGSLSRPVIFTIMKLCESTTAAKEEAGSNDSRIMIRERVDSSLNYSGGSVVFSVRRTRTRIESWVLWQSHT